MLLFKISLSLSLFLVNKHKPWIETTYHGIVTENDNTVLLDPPLIALDKDSPLRFAGKRIFCLFSLGSECISWKHDWKGCLDRDVALDYVTWYIVLVYWHQPGKRRELCPWKASLEGYIFQEYLCCVWTDSQCFRVGWEIWYLPDLFSVVFLLKTLRTTNCMVGNGGGKEMRGLSAHVQPWNVFSATELTPQKSFLVFPSGFQ